MAYTYDQSIRSSHLRLLRPLSITHTELSFNIVTVQRASSPLYTAVSYTWGTEDPTETIQLNGRAFRVRPNLWSCLHYISQAARQEPWNYLWVDAICIDQGNVEERNEQVKCMDQTYASAAAVSVWLGLAPLPDWVQIPDSARRSPIKTLEVGNLSWSDHIDDLANRPYWSRYWVLQEFLLARNLKIYCSDTSMDWMLFKDLVEDETGVYGTPRSQSLRPSAALPVVQGRHPDKHPETYQRLADLLRAHHRSQCKDPRDRIFALLGLIPPDDRVFLDRVFPDYTLSEDVVQIIALAHVMQHDSMDELDLKKITTGADSIFLGLGVKSTEQRRRILRLAKELDYIGDIHPDQVVELLEDDARLNASAHGESLLDAMNVGDQEQFGEFEALLRESIYGYEEQDRSRHGGGKWMRWVGVASCVVVGWYFWSKRG